MPLIKCPMCDKDISPNAISCPHCGEPMVKGNKQQSNIYKDDECIIYVNKNKECNVVLADVEEKTTKIMGFIRQLIDCDIYEVKDIVDSPPCTLCFEMQYEEANEIKNQLESLGATAYLINSDDEDSMQKIQNQIPEEKLMIECPNCKSTNTNKISGASKFGSALLFGVFSLGRLNKTWECNRCGYRW
jgi:ribosomal protein L7/L12